MDFLVDEGIKEQALAAIRAGVGRARFMAFLPVAGERCLIVETQCPGTTTFKLVEPADLFGHRAVEDITLAVGEAMAADVRWLKHLNRRA